MSRYFNAASIFFRRDLIEIDWDKRWDLRVGIDIGSIPKDDEHGGWSVIRIGKLGIAAKLGICLPFGWVFRAGFYQSNGDQLVVETPFRNKKREGDNLDPTPRHYFNINMPWQLSYHRSEMLFRHDERWRKRDPAITHPSGTWVRIPDQLPRYEDGVGTEWTMPFVHDEGNLHQEVTVKVKGSRMTWRRRWLPFTDLFCHTSECVDLKFSEEMGPERGSWKGGATGMGFEMKPGETVEQTVERAAKEIKFGR